MPTDPRNLLADRALVLGVVGRVSPGIRMDQAQVELLELFRRAIEDDARRVFDVTKLADVTLASAEHGMSSFQATYSGALELLGRLVTLALAVACANIACLLLARSVARRREIAVRLAIGAGRGRLLTQLLTEGLVLSLLGAALGIALGFWGSRFLALSLDPGMRAEALTWTRPGAGLWVLTTAVVSFTTLVFALVPAWAARRVQPARDLQPARALGNGTRLAGNRAGWIAQWIVAAEVAATLVLLVCAGLFVRTVIHFVTFDPGFQADHLLTVAVSPAMDQDASAVGAEVEALRARVARVRGVEAATWSSRPLLGGGMMMGVFPFGSGDHMTSDPVAELFVGPRFFRTMGVPLIVGRDVEESDCRAGAPSVWISRSLADLHFSGINSVGASWVGHVVAGVVGDTYLDNIRSPRQPTVYFPRPTAGGYLQLRTAGAPLSLAGPVEAAAHELAPHLLIRSMNDAAQQLEAEAGDQRLLAGASLALGGLTLLLAAVGLYGVLSYSVSRRTGEIAIRMALGAVRTDVLRLILGDGSRVVLAGALLGAVGSYWAARSFAHFLFGVRPLDPLTYAVATLVLLTVAALATYLPASRASRVDPAVALRAE
jgi:predicted permease